MSSVVTLIRVYKERMVTSLTLLTYITVSGVGVGREDLGFFPEPFRELKSQDHTVWGVGLTQQID